MNPKHSDLYKKRCRTFEAFGGAVKLYMLPYSSIEHDRVILQLERITPKRSWTNIETKEVVYTIPEELVLERAAARRLGAEMAYTPWQEAYLWTDAESAFTVIAGYCIDIEFAAELPAEAQGLRDYWDARTGVIADDYDLFCVLLDNATPSMLWQAYAATRSEAQVKAPEA